MRLDYTSDLWWKNAVVYCLDVETFRDSDGDGVGDFRGLIDEIDYLAGLGVTCLWLMPFYPSPNRDDGYDISDYYAVDPRLGTLGDFVELVRTAADRGIRVILDLVVNHTSEKHPWFAEARASRDSPRRDWYVWRDEPAAEPASIAFPDKETSNWQRDRKSGQYYLHRFYRFMPDLNISSPAVRDEICKIAGFWLTLGAAGFRIDAVPFLCELDGISHPVDGDPKGWLRSLRAFVNRRNGQAMLLGEVNASLQELASYFGDEDGDALHMEFAFMVNQSLWLALARESAEPLEQVISTLPKVPHDNAWATFLRNHDELSLDKLTVTQREEVFAAFAPDDDMRMYGHGIRRRAAADGVEPDVLAAGHAGPVHGRRARARRAARDPRPLRRARADAVVARAQRRVLRGAGRAARAPPVRRRVRAREGQRHRPAARPRLAAALRAAADPPAPRDAGAGVGHLDADRDRAPRRVRPPLR